MFELFEVPPHKRKQTAHPSAEQPEARSPQEMADLVRQVADEVVEGVLLELYGLDALSLLEEGRPPWADWVSGDDEGGNWGDEEDVDNGPNNGGPNGDR